MQAFALSTRASWIQKSIFKGPISHQVSSFNTLQNQNLILHEENENLKKLSLLAEEKESFETQLAAAISAASFNLNEKSKLTKSLRKPLRELMSP